MGIDALIKAGLTYRQIDYWTTRGYLIAAESNPGNGHARDWSADEVRLAGVMVRLVHAGLSVQAAHQIVRKGADLAPGIRVEVQ